MKHETEKKIQKSRTINWVRWAFSELGLPLGIVLLLTTFIGKPVAIASGSMENTLLVGDRLLVNVLSYGPKVPGTDWQLPALKSAKAGDIIVFEPPFESEAPYVKRCIATAGQTVEIRGKDVYVDGRLMPLPEAGKFVDRQVQPQGYQQVDINPPGAGNRDYYGPVVVPPDHLFMLGDNRDDSLDSRYWGFLPENNVIGKIELLLFSWDSQLPLYRIAEKIRWDRLAQHIQ